MSKPNAVPPTPTRGASTAPKASMPATAAAPSPAPGGRIDTNILQKLQAGEDIDDDDVAPLGMSGDQVKTVFAIFTTLLPTEPPAPTQPTIQVTTLTIQEAVSLQTFEKNESTGLNEELQLDTCNSTTFHQFFFAMTKNFKQAYWRDACQLDNRMDALDDFPNLTKTVIRTTILGHIAHASRPDDISKYGSIYHKDRALRFKLLNSMTTQSATDILTHIKTMDWTTIGEDRKQNSGLLLFGIIDKIFPTYGMVAKLTRDTIKKTLIAEFGEENLLHAYDEYMSRIKYCFDILKLRKSDIEQHTEDLFVAMRKIKSKKFQSGLEKRYRKHVTGKKPITSEDLLVWTQSELVVLDNLKTLTAPDEADKNSDDSMSLSAELKTVNDTSKQLMGLVADQQKTVTKLIRGG